MEMRISNLALILLLLILCDSTMGQKADDSRAGQPESALLDKLRIEGSDALYSLDYDAARVKFKEITRVFPDHPAGPLLLANSLWLEKLNESRRLQASLYSTQSFFAKTDEKPEPKLVEQFRQWTRMAKQLAEARLKRNPRDVEALYFIGATKGIKAGFAATVERRFSAALRDGSDGVDNHRAVIKLDPSFRDAELSIGLYDYILGSLPPPVRILASIFGARGSKKRGITTLERVAKDGGLAREDAKVLLIALYKREKRFADALALSRNLAEKYPRNYLFKLEAADALSSLIAVEKHVGRASVAAEHERQALEIFDTLLKEKNEREPGPALDLIHLRYGEAALAANQPDKAAKQFLAAASASNAERSIVTLANLRAGQCFDLLGKRDEAIARYNEVLKRPNVYNSQEDARRWLSRAVSARSPTLRDGLNSIPPPMRTSANQVISPEIQIRSTATSRESPNE